MPGINTTSSAAGPWRIVFYETENGRSPVREWLLAMSAEERGLAFNYIDQLARLGIEARRPLVAPLENKLYELRWKAENKQYRIAYFAAAGRIFVFLHAIVKKQSAWPRQDLQVAEERMKDYERRK